MGLQVNRLAGMAYHAALPPAYIVGAAVESSNCPASPRYVKHC